MVKRLTVGACGAVLVLGLLAAGCTPEPGPGSSPSPTPDVSSATPSPSSPTPTENAQERQQRLDFEAAEKAYLIGTAEYQRLLMAGGTSEPTKILLATTGGFQLEATMNALRLMKRNGWHTDRPATQVVVENGGWAPTELRLSSCEDTSSVKFLSKSGKEVFKDRELRYVHDLTARKTKGVWRIVSSKSRPVKDFSNEDGCS